MAAAVGEVFAVKAVHSGEPGRNVHPFGVIAAAPGVGKTRALLELKETLLRRCRPEDLSVPSQHAALAALQAGAHGEHYVELLVLTFNNGNGPCKLDMEVRAGRSLAVADAVIGRPAVEGRTEVLVQETNMFSNRYFAFRSWVRPPA